MQTNRYISSIREHSFLLFSFFVFFFHDLTQRRDFFCKPYMARSPIALRKPFNSVLAFYRSPIFLGALLLCPRAAPRARVNHQTDAANLA